MKSCPSKCSPSIAINILFLLAERESVETPTASHLSKSEGKLTNSEFGNIVFISL
jgi:hypothetical protein